MKTQQTIELSIKSLTKAKENLLKFRNAYLEGIDNAVYLATEAMYNKVVQYCSENGISNHIGEIQRNYDKETKIGRVWTNNDVIIFNEMGTGITGLNNPHPNPSKEFKSWIYDKNEHGEKGWWYPTTESDPNPYKWMDSNGTLRAWTKGLPSRHMFHDAFEDIKNEIGDIVAVEIRKSVGDLY